MDDKLITAAQLAQRWQMSEGTLQNMRTQGRGPNYTKIAGIRYRLSDVEKYEIERLVDLQNIRNKKTK